MDVGVEEATVVVDFGAFGGVEDVDYDFGVELDAFEEADFGGAEDVKSDGGSIGFIGGFDFEDGVLICEVELSIEYFLFKPLDES